MFEAALIAKLIAASLFYTACVDWFKGNKQDGTMLFSVGVVFASVGLALFWMTMMQH
jgi:hypothetical protein